MKEDGDTTFLFLTNGRDPETEGSNFRILAETEFQSLDEQGTEDLMFFVDEANDYLEK